MLTEHELKKIKDELAGRMLEGEEISDLLQGVYSAAEAAGSPVNDMPGVIFLTTKRIFFIFFRNGREELRELAFADVLSFHFNDAENSAALTMRLPDQTLRFASSETSECTRRFTAALRRALADREEKVVFYDYGSNYDFLVGEAGKILTGLETYFNKENSDFCRLLVSDIITLAFMVVRSKKLLSDKEIFFMTLVLLVLHPDIAPKDKETVCGIINEFELEHVHDVNGLWPKVARFFPESMAEPVTVLPSLDYVGQVDKEQGSRHLDVIRSHLFNFTQCLIKADGRITQSEISTEENLNALLFGRKPPGTAGRNKGTHGSGLRIGPNAGPAAASGPPAAGSDPAAGTLTSAPRTGRSPRKKSGTRYNQHKAPKNKIGAPAEHEETLESVLEKINALVGMKNIKQEIGTLVNLIKIRKARRERGLPASAISLHAVFYGPPGTGKTTIARLLGKVYKCLGLLQKGHIVETDRAGLVAGYVGQTAIQVNGLVQKSLDGILFIDEAYALKPGGGGSDFGQEAIDTILKRMEDQRERLVVIVAGYPDEMKRFIESNPGLKSRFSRYFYFTDYKPRELISIFEIFCKNAAYNLTGPARAKLLELLRKLYAAKDRTFGNGRLVRNIFEKVIENQANRLVKISPLTGEILSSIQKADIPTEQELNERSPVIK
jgi:stage V sporulation protein K